MWPRYSLSVTGCGLARSRRSNSSFASSLTSAMHHSQMIALVVCCAVVAAVQGASVVRVPRVYNILIKSDGALAQSEAVSASGSGEQGDAPLRKDAPSPSSSSAEQQDQDDDDEEAAADDGPREQQLPILNAKEGAVQEGVNYTQVPLSRAYPLTRYTAPIIAAHYPFPYLHGGLILGPVPKLSAPQQEYAEQRSNEDLEEPQLQQQQQEYEREQDVVRPIQQLPLPQYRMSNVQSPSSFRARLGQQLPRGAFEDDDTDSVRVEAQQDDVQDDDDEQA